MPYQLVAYGKQTLFEVVELISDKYFLDFALCIIYTMKFFLP